MQIQPLSDRVVLRAVEKEKITASGIFLPDSAKNEPPHLYEVVSVGPGKKDKNGEMITIDLAPGDRVISGRYSGDEVEIEGEKLKIVAFEYILAKVA